jgi:hypothetical protein
MITRKTISQSALLITAVAVLALNGCSMIGLGIGVSIDSSKPNQKTVPGWQATAIKPGAPINVILKDGSWLHGKYSGLGRVPAEQYAALYSQARERKPEGILLPALGESIEIETSVRLFKEFEEKLEGTFEGFEHDRILSKLIGTTVLSGVPLSFVTKIAAGKGRVISGETIKELILAGQIPVMSAIVIEREAGKTQVAMNDVRQIEIPVKKHAALEGFLIGAVIDTAIVFAVIRALSDLSLNLWGE